MKTVNAPAPAVTPAPTTPPPTDPPPTPTDGTLTPVEDPNEDPAPAPEPEEDFLLSIIHRDLNPEKEPDIEPAPEPAPAPADGAPASPPVAEPAAAPAQPAPAITPADQQPPAKPAKKRFKSIAKGDALIDSAPAPAYQPPVPPPPAPEAPAPDQRLTQDQIEELQEAEVAARLFPDRKGYPEALKRYYSEFTSKMQALVAENPNITESDEAYQSLIRSKPRLKDPELKKVLKTIAKEEAVTESRKEIQPRLESIEMTAKRAEILPAIDNWTRNTFTQGIKTLIEQDEQSPLAAPLKLVKEKGVDAAREEYPLEFDVMSQSTQRTQMQVKEFLLLSKRATAFDEKNQIHSDIASFINSQGKVMVERGGKDRVRDGKQFMPRADFIAMVSNDPKEGATFDPARWSTARFWTFDDVAIVDMLALKAKNDAELTIKQELERANKYGFQRVNSKKVDKTQTATGAQPAPINPPKTTTSVTPGAANPAPNKAADSDDPIPVSTLVSHLKIKK